MKFVHAYQPPPPAAIRRNATKRIRMSLIAVLARSRTSCAGPEADPSARRCRFSLLAAQAATAARRVARQVEVRPQIRTAQAGAARVEPQAGGVAPGRQQAPHASDCHRFSPD